MQIHATAQSSLLSNQKTSARNKISTHALSSDSIKFSGYATTLKFPIYVQNQLNFLTEKLGLPAEKIAHLASGILPDAHYLPSEAKEPTLMMMNTEALSALNVEEKYPPEDPNADRYYSVKMKESDFQAWCKENSEPVNIGQSGLQRLREWFPIKKKITFDDNRKRDGMEGALNVVFGCIFFPLAPLFILNHLLVKRSDRKRVFNGINILHEAAQKKLAKPNLALVSYTASQQLDENYKPIASEIKEFRFTQINRPFEHLQSKSAE